MNPCAKLIPSALAAAALAVAGIAPALAIGDVENRPARLVGAGSVAVGDGSVRVAADLPCPGEDVGFNPQPDPPGRLDISWADSSFQLEAVTAASCSNNLHQGTGIGTCGGEAGFVINWSFTDGDRAGIGNPDTRDFVQLDIAGERAACALSVAGPLERGNVQFIGNPDIAPEVHAEARWVTGGARAPVPPGSGCDNAGYATIQAAVDDASPGDTVLVCPGTYTENVVILTDHLTVLSTDGAAVTTVEAPANPAPYLASLGYNHVFHVRASGLTLDGFTVVPAGTADPDIGVHVANEGETDLRLVNNDIVGGRIGINLGCGGFGTRVDHNTLTAQTEGGINIDTCEMPPFPGSHHNSIHHNTACGATLTASIATGGSSNYNRIHHNTATSISVFGTGNVVHNNTTQQAVVDSGSGNNLHHNTTDPAVCS